ncbi:hypothetical protein CT0861_02187 [Colletotrichum tofieldiae]|uniref:Uncharacterized protein n=1 Tax=Colletotrichum tofieldiae TaxID=708197 RepID=A0A166LE66_9PEZI|nr:hypothetical protein CT0861_02187 [Colletotrichum tofieldiae]
MLGQDPRTDFAFYLLDFEGEDLDESLYDEEEAHLGDEEASTFLMSSVFFHRTTGEDIFLALKTSEESPKFLHTYEKTPV